MTIANFRNKITFFIQQFFNSTIQQLSWLLIPLAVFAVYFPALEFDFTGLDEKWLITNKLELLKNPGSIPELFSSHTLYAYYRPLLMLTFMADTLAGDGIFFYYHFTNLVIHVLASIAFFVMIREWGFSQKTSLLLALLFAIHPLHVHAVAWVPGRNDSLLGLFAFLSVFFYFRYIKSNAIPLAGALVFFILALLTKEGAIMIPASFVLAWIVKRSEVTLNKIAVPLLASIIIAAAWYFFRSGIAETGRGIRVTDFTAAVQDAALALIMDISKTIFPVHQSVFPTVQDTPLLFPALIVTGTILLIFITGVVNKKIFFAGIAWFFAFHILSVLVGATDGTWNHYEHRVYVPAAGMLLALSQVNFSRFFEKRKITLYLLYGLLCAAFIVKIQLRLPVYENASSFIHTATVESPNVPIFHSLLAEMYVEEKKDSAAISQYTIHLQLEPGRERTLVNRGYLYFKRGEHGKAIDDYTLAIKNSRAPGPIYARRMLSYYYRKEYFKSYQDAMKAQQYGVQVNEKFIDRSLKGLQQYQAYGKGDTNLQKLPHALAYNDRGLAFYNNSHIPLALSDFNTAIALDSAFAEAWYNRSMLHCKTGDYKTGTQDLEKAESLGYEVDSLIRKTVEELYKKKTGNSHLR
jgi:tetratricopeptide (TPR) repeat protein